MTEPKHVIEDDVAMGAIRLGADIGTKGAVSMMRAGQLRLSPLEHETGQYPYDEKLRPLRATILVWRAWLRETIGL